MTLGKKKGRDFSPKFYQTVDWFNKHKSGFAVDCAEAIGCDRTQLSTYCEKLVKDGFLSRERRKFPEQKGSGIFYYKPEAPPHDAKWNNPDLPKTLSLLSVKEMEANGAFVWPYVREGRGKRASYGPSEAEVKRKREIQKLYEKLKVKKATTKRKVVSLV